MNNTETIIDTLKRRDLLESVKNDIIPILEQHMDRIEFVRNFVGLSDILYFEEKDMYLYEYPMFLSLGCKTESDSDERFVDLFTDVYEKAVTKPGDIYDNLWEFFESTDRTLYVEVGFKENILDNDDILNVFNDMPSHRDKEPYELMIEHYKYPEWYKVKSGKEIFSVRESIDLIKRFEQKVLSNKITELKSQIDELLIEDKFTEIKLITKKIKKLENQLN